MRAIWLLCVEILIESVFTQSKTYYLLVKLQTSGDKNCAVYQYSISCCTRRLCINNTCPFSHIQGRARQHIASALLRHENAISMTAICENASLQRPSKIITIPLHIRIRSALSLWTQNSDAVPTSTEWQGWFQIPRVMQCARNEPINYRTPHYINAISR